MRKLAYIFFGITILLAILTLLKTNLLASDGKKMQEIMTGLGEAQERVGRMEEEIARAKSLKTVTVRAGELGFGGATVRRIGSGDKLAVKYGEKD